jgi:cholesterol transport system auxiliary component
VSKSKASIALCLAAALSLTGCLNLGGAKPPPTLMRLSAVSPLPPQTDRTATASQAVTVVVPTVPQELAALRVPVTKGGISVAYLKDAQWVEQPNALFARLLSETIAATTGRVVLDPRQFSLDPGVRLTGQLQAFGLDADTMEVVARYDAALARGADRVETHRFEARVKVAAAEPAAVSPALNQAANQIAADVARWIGS